MMETKPIDHLEIPLCQFCDMWIKPDSYEVPGRAYYYCNKGEKTYSEEPCNTMDFKLCPFNKRGE